MTVLDMSQFTQAKSDQFNAEDFLGGPRTFRIAGVSGSGNKEQPVNIKFEGEELLFRPCKTVRRVMVGVWGADASQYVGRALTLYRDPKVKYGGMQVGGIRVSHMSHIDEDKVIVAMEAQGRKTPIKIAPLPMPRTTSRSPASPVPQADTGETVQHDAGAGAASTGVPDVVQAWVNETVAEIRACQSIAELAELQANKKVGIKLERFPKERDDLNQMFADRRAVLDGGEWGE